MLESKINDTITIREVLESDLALYRDLRLEALRFEPGAFSAGRTRARAPSAAGGALSWHGQALPHHQFLGLKK